MIASPFQGVNDHLADCWVQVTRHDTDRMSGFVVLDKLARFRRTLYDRLRTCGWHNA